MQSPKFSFSSSNLNTHVNPNKIRDAWKKKTKHQLRKQAIWDLIEFRDLDQSIKETAERISNDISSAKYQVNCPKNYLVEKSRGLCRQMTLAHPEDLLVLQCLSSALQSQIDNNSPSQSAFYQPGDMKWSKGKMTIDVSDYGALASWKRFQKAILNFQNENEFVVVTDIANFYDFINFNHLRNIVSSLCNVDEPLLDLLIFVLNGLAWVPDYMPRQQMGMPQLESDAPRVLANAMLFELDKVIENKSKMNYARFMDDIDFGANSIPESKSTLRDIDLTLQSRQLRLNSAKTKILQKKDAFIHFCVDQNNRLDIILNKIQNQTKKGKISNKTLKEVNLLYEEWQGTKNNGEPKSDSPFHNGNGQSTFQ